MTTIHPGAGPTIGPQPPLVRPRTAWLMLGCGNAHGYALLNAGELESFMDGRARKITVDSIHRYIARMIAAASPESSSPCAASQRRRGRPRKVPLSPEATR
jgi:hypothetical protein